MRTVAQNTFKPFLVESGRYGKSIFRVMEVAPYISREQVEHLLEELPIYFQLRKDLSMSSDNLNEPLEVYVHGVIVSIYPPKRRVIACTAFDSWNAAKVVSKMHVDNVMDTMTPGNGQLRSCVHFDPLIFGIRDWPGTATMELEIDIHVFPRNKETETRLVAPTFGKWDVRKLLELIAGGEKPLSLEQLRQWRELIMYAVQSMRSCYENPDTAEDYPVRVYYKPCWLEIEAAARNDEKLIAALDSLRGSIQWE